jgi:hypothetical protein
MAVFIQGQEVFKVPEISDGDKYENMAGQATALIVNTINYAKSLGKTLDEAASFTGESFKTSWNHEAGFKGFVNGTLYLSVLFFPGATITINEQSENLMKSTVELSPEYIKIFPLFDVSLEEYLAFYKGVVTIIGEYLGAEYTHEFNGNKISVTIRKK